MGVAVLVLLLAGVVAYAWHRQTGAFDVVVEQARNLLRPARPLPRRVLPRRLLREAANTVTVGVSGTVLVPTRIEISVHPGDLESFEDALDWLARDIADTLRQRATEHGWVVPSGPEVVIIPDEERPLRSPRARGRLGALSPDDISTLKHKGPLALRPDAAPTAAAPPSAAAPRTVAAPPGSPPAGADDATRIEALAVPPAAPPADEPAPPPGPEAHPERHEATPPTGFMPPVTAAAAAASAAAAAQEHAEQQERAVFLQLMAVDGGDDLSAVVLASGRPIVLGRSRQADIQVKDRKASGRHCAFSLDPDDGTLTIEDLQSTNGTFVDGKRVEIATLRSGDTLVVGTSTWRVELDELTL
ncbi:MAG TPA: FhaA domain-containing protein [Acidimicrobiales bacterium]